MLVRSIKSAISVVAISSVLGLLPASAQKARAEPGAALAAYVTLRTIGDLLAAQVRGSSKVRELESRRVNAKLDAVLKNFEDLAEAMKALDSRIKSIEGFIVSRERMALFRGIYAVWKDAHRLLEAAKGADERNYGELADIKEELLADLRRNSRLLNSWVELQKDDLGDSLILVSSVHTMATATYLLSKLPAKKSGNDNASELPLGVRFLLNRQQETISRIQEAGGLRARLDVASASYRKEIENLKRPLLICARKEKTEWASRSVKIVDKECQGRSATLAVTLCAVGIALPWTGTWLIGCGAGATALGGCTKEKKERYLRTTSPLHSVTLEVEAKRELGVGLSTKTVKWPVQPMWKAEYRSASDCVNGKRYSSPVKAKEGLKEFDKSLSKVNALAHTADIYASAIKLLESAKVTIGKLQQKGS